MIPGLSFKRFKCKLWIGLSNIKVLPGVPGMSLYTGLMSRTCTQHFGAAKVHFMKKSCWTKGPKQPEPNGKFANMLHLVLSLHFMVFPSVFNLRSSDWALEFTGPILWPILRDPRLETTTSVVPRHWKASLVLPWRSLRHVTSSPKSTDMQRQRI